MNHCQNRSQRVKWQSFGELPFYSYGLSPFVKYNGEFKKQNVLEPVLLKNLKLALL